MTTEPERKPIDDAESSYVTSLIDRITDPQTGWGPMWAQFHGETFPPQAPPAQAPPDPERQQT